MPQQNHPLKVIIEKFELANAKGKKCLFVFDLDSTLFDVTPRIQKIINDFTQVNAHHIDFPNETKLCQNAKVERTDWGFVHALERLGINADHAEQFFDVIKGFWHHRFFGNDYLIHDEPYEGALQFLNRINSNNLNEIVYLTGRDVARMETGTIESLHQHQFPLDNSRSTLALKPHKSMDDTQFKSDWFDSINIEQYEHVWFFENEPLNLEKVRIDHPKVELIFFDSTHSSKLPSPNDLPTICNYLY